MVGDDLDVAPEGLVLARVPRVVAPLGAGYDPVGADKSAVEAHEGLTLVVQVPQDVGQLWGVADDDLEGLV